MTQISFTLDPASMNKTLLALKSKLPTRIRQAVRKGVFKVGAGELRLAKATAPRGRTGQFRRSLAKKDIRYSARSTYQTIVGHRYEKRSTARQVASAGRRTGAISKGLSGRGLAPAIWWVDRGTTAHTIPAKNKRLMAWNIIAGGRRLRKARFGKVVRHRGHAGTGFMTRLIRTGNSRRERGVVHEVQSALRGLGLSFTP